MIKDVIEGLMIVQKYKPESWVCAEHDIIYSDLEHDAPSEEDAAALRDLHWHTDGDVDVWTYYV